MNSSVGSFGILAFALMAFSIQADEPSSAGSVRALIVVGLPGDSEHETLFRLTAARWKDWLVGSLGIAPKDVRILNGPEVGSSPGWGDAPATREAIAREVETFQQKTKAGDRAWVFVLGHANLDDGHAFLHLPGPDLRDDQFAALFEGLPAKEQVFWLTTPASGAFLPPLSKAGRIVVAATERSGESNETEFPHALSEVIARPFERLDLDKDGQVSILELFLSTVQAVDARFQVDKRAPTEHAQLDDDGDGQGTEPKPEQTKFGPDGTLASRTFLPKITPKPSSRSPHGTDRAAPPPR